MRQRKYTLPRHTNIANQGPRIGAFLIDLAISLAITLTLLFGCFRFVFNFKTKPLYTKIEEERIKSQLFFKSESGALDYYGVESENEPFLNALKSFYLTYIPEANPDVASDFTPEWFNANVLKIEGDGKYFFVLDEDDQHKPGIINTEADKQSVNSFLQKAWLVANATLNKVPSFRQMNNEFTFYNSLEFVLSAIIGFAVAYIVIPICLKNGTTAGKKAFGLCLADSDGYKVRNAQLLMRMMPLTVILLSFLLPLWRSMFVVLIVVLVVFLVSFSLAMASPKKSSLHDFTARTIVVNAKTSILFNNAAEEEEYILKEDNEQIVVENTGEEPTLKYEK